MKNKIFIGISLTALILFISFEIVYASTIPVSSGKIFGGKITETKAEKISSLEDDGYTCDVQGTSIEINPITGPTGYIIPEGVTSKTGYETRSGQWIIGKYSGETTVTCTSDDDDEDQQTVTLPNITIFGTSK